MAFLNSKEDLETLKASVTAIIMDKQRELLYYEKQLDLVSNALAQGLFCDSLPSKTSVRYDADDFKEQDARLENFYASGL